MRKATRWIFWLTIAALGIYDIFAYFLADNATISVYVWELTQHSTFATPITFWLGYLCGHWFSRPHVVDKPKDW